MNKITIIVVLLLIVPDLKAQKKEFRKAQQEVSAGNYASAASFLSQAKRIFAAADSKTRAQYYVVEAELRLAEKELDLERIKLISESVNHAYRYELTPSLRESLSQINLKINKFSASVAASELANKNYSNAAELYKTAYQTTEDNNHLLKAARCYLLAEEYGDAYQAYNDLYNKGYTNAKIQYVATNLASSKKEAFSSKSKRDEAVAAGLYKNPEIITTNSKLPEILRGITVAAIPLGKKHEAVAIVDNALAKMPENKILLNQVSHLYRKLDAHDKYNAIIDRLIKETPNDPNLYYNSAVTSAQNNDYDRAKKFYKKALEVDPNYINAEVNLATLLLEQDKVINDEMNELGVAEADDKRYKKLKQKRSNLYYEVIPYLESIVKSQPQNEDFAKKLKNIYNFIGNSTQIASEEKLDD